MPIKVYKVADIIDGKIVFSRRRGRRFQGDEKEVVTALRTLECPADPLPPDDRIAFIKARGLPDAVERAAIASLRTKFTFSYSGSPVFLPEDKPTRLVYFNGRLFMSERIP